MKFIIYNDKLNPDFWNENKEINPELREALFKLAETFYTDIEIKAPVEDVYFLGSSANYNWTPTSDIDLHLIINFNKLKMPKEDARKYADALAKKWNADQDVNIKGHNVEVYIQDINEKKSFNWNLFS